MLNSIETYTESGRKAAKFANKSDWAAHDFESSWFRRAIALEKDEDKAVARAAYDAGFKEERNVPRVQYFA